MAIAEKYIGTGSRIEIPNPSHDPVGENRAFYSIYYDTERDDSPPQSRISLAKRIEPLVALLPVSSIGLDLGSGRQIFEFEHIPDIPMVTVDLADLEPCDLLALSNRQTHHVQASGTQMPFADVQFAIAVSNMAFDFMPTESRDELQRVLKPNAWAIMNLHHPSIIPVDLDEKIMRYRRKIRNKIRFDKASSRDQDQMELNVLIHKKYLRDEHILFESPGQIKAIFTAAGFDVYRVEEAVDKMGYKWWEVDMQKSDRKPHTSDQTIRGPHNSGERREAKRYRKARITQLNNELSFLNSRYGQASHGDPRFGKIEERRQLQSGIIVDFQGKPIDLNRTF